MMDILWQDPDGLVALVRLDTGEYGMALRDHHADNWRVGDVHPTLYGAVEEMQRYFDVPVEEISTDPVLAGHLTRSEGAQAIRDAGGVAFVRPEDMEFRLIVHPEAPPRSLTADTWSYLWCLDKRVFDDHKVTVRRLTARPEEQFFDIETSNGTIRWVDLNSLRGTIHDELQDALYRAVEDFIDDFDLDDDIADAVRDAANMFAVRLAKAVLPTLPRQPRPGH